MMQYVMFRLGLISDYVRLSLAEFKLKMYHYLHRPWYTKQIYYLPLLAKTSIVQSILYGILAFLFVFPDVNACLYSCILSCVAIHLINVRYSYIISIPYAWNTTHI